MPQLVAPRRTPAAGAARALAGYVLLTLGLTYPAVTVFSRAIPGDGFDGWQNLWNLWWMRHALLDLQVHPWFTSLLYYPTGVGLLFHTLNPFNGLASLPIQLAWGLLPGYNWVVLFSFAVGGMGAYLLARYVLGARSSRLAAFGAGIAFAFSPFHFAHLLGHMQVISLEWLPFFALYLIRTVDSLSRRATPNSNPARETKGVWRNAAMAVFFLVLVALCDWYYVLYCLFFSAIVAGWAAFRTWRAAGALPGAPRIRRLLPALSTLIAIWIAWAVVMSPLLVPMIREAQQFDFMIPDPEQSRILSADLLAYVTPQELHPLWGAWAQRAAQRFTSTVSEHQVFAGFAVLGLAAIALRHGVKRAPAAARRGAASEGQGIGLWLATLVTFFVLSLGPVLHVGGRSDLLPGGRELLLPYGWLARAIPFMEISRSVSRLDAMVTLALAILAAAGLARVVNLRRWGASLTAIALVLMLFEFLPAPYPMSAPDTPAWYSVLGDDSRSGAVLNLPANWDRPRYLLYQTEHRKPLTAAYISRDDPRTLIDRAPVLQHFRHLGPDIIEFDLAAQGRQVLADLGVKWVVLDRYQMPGGEEREYTEAAAAQVFGGQPPLFEDDRLTAYEVGGSDARSPYLVLGPGWEPLDEQARSRAFVGDARLIVQSPATGAVKIKVTTTVDSAPPDLEQVGDDYVLVASVQPGTNELVLRARRAGERVVITRLAIER